MPDDIVRANKSLTVKLATDEDSYRRINRFSEKYSSGIEAAPHELRQTKKQLGEFQEFFVETDKEDIIAVAVCKLQDKDEVYIEYFYVRDDIRGHRIGQLLMASVISYYKKNYPKVKRIGLTPGDISWQESGILERFKFNDENGYGTYVLRL